MGEITGDTSSLRIMALIQWYDYDSKEAKTALLAPRVHAKT
jgi:hypothetical protein